jgi:hypothetical protein
MNSKAKQKIAHEFKEFLIVSLFLAPFFLAFEGFKISLVHEPGNSLFKYGIALLNALVLSKIILMGELIGLGKKSERKPLIVSTIHKAGMFTVLYEPDDAGTLQPHSDGREAGSAGRDHPTSHDRKLGSSPVKVPVAAQSGQIQ